MTFTLSCLEWTRYPNQNQNRERTFGSHVAGPRSVSGQETNVDPNREPRTSRLLAGQMRLEDGTIVKMRVRNLSSHGMGGKAEEPIAPHQAVELLLTGIGPVAGRVAWVRGDQFGVRLDQEIDPALATFAAPSPRESDFVVPLRNRPVTDFKRPGVRRS